MANSDNERNYKEEIKQEAFTLPNLFSYLRLILIPVFVVLYVKDHYAYALGVLIVSWVSDVLDGFIARRFNMVTDLGKVLDPLADKLTQAAMIICVATTYHTMWILVGLLVIKELAMFTMGLYVLKVTNELNSARWYGKLCTAAMFAALICVATMLIQIPSPLNGYVNFGDCFILVAAWVLGPVWGFAAGGIGSALADMFTGYFHYVPGTFVIKGLIAVAAALICHAIASKSEKLRLPAYIAGAAAGEVIMVGGYYLYAALLLGKSFAGAAASVPGNLVQGAFGLVCGVVIIRIIARTRVLSRFGAYAVY